jgi:lipase (class 3)
MKPHEEALICAQASEAIYGTVDDPVGRVSSQTAMDALGFSNFVWIDLTGVFKDLCAFVVSSDDYHLLVFRGTKLPQDWMTDLACTPVRFDWVFPAAPAIGEIHAGFGHCLSDGLSDIISALSPRDYTKPLLITGHSLGGALAALAGAYFSVLGSSLPSVSAIYTFGQPRIGLHDFCNTYSRILANKLVRFVNKQDLVPRVPFRNWDYSDEGTMIHFDSSGKPAIESPEWQNFLARSLQSFGDFFEIISHLQVDVGDHSMAGYRDLIEQNQAALAPLLQ